MNCFFKKYIHGNKTSANISDYVSMYFFQYFTESKFRILMAKHICLTVFGILLIENALTAMHIVFILFLHNIFLSL